ncbi:hypothetical protein M0R45_030814 [Rubus argutus]|uniref:Uncharacterized protein n=1 Tax=Rubus argutus TaxID=59490 RepID=A0AAW1WCY7_RUBAR
MNNFITKSPQATSTASSNHRTLCQFHNHHHPIFQPVVIKSPSPCLLCKFTTPIPSTVASFNQFHHHQIPNRNQNNPIILIPILKPAKSKTVTHGLHCLSLSVKATVKSPVTILSSLRRLLLPSIHAAHSTGIAVCSFCISLCRRLKSHHHGINHAATFQSMASLETINLTCAAVLHSLPDSSPRPVKL